MKFFETVHPIIDKSLVWYHSLFPFQLESQHFFYIDFIFIKTKLVLQSFLLILGMSPDGVLSEHQKQIRFRKLIQKRRIQGEPVPKSFLGTSEQPSNSKHDNDEKTHKFGQGKNIYQFKKSGLQDFLEIDAEGGTLLYDGLGLN